MSVLEYYESSVSTALNSKYVWKEARIADECMERLNELGRKWEAQDHQPPTGDASGRGYSSAPPTEGNIG